jgi:hypothetical protein
MHSLAFCGDNCQNQLDGDSDRVVSSFCEEDDGAIVIALVSTSVPPFVSRLLRCHLLSSVGMKSFEIYLAIPSWQRRGSSTHFHSPEYNSWSPSMQVNAGQRLDGQPRLHRREA